MAYLTLPFIYLFIYFWRDLINPETCQWPVSVLKFKRGAFEVWIRSASSSAASLGSGVAVRACMRACARLYPY